MWLLAVCVVVVDVVVVVVVIIHVVVALRLQATVLNGISVYCLTSLGHC